MKIVINRCYGGFGLSPEAVTEFCKLESIDAPKNFYDGDISRDNPSLIKVVEDLGKKANDSLAKLRVVEIPDGVDWEIDEYGGIEWVTEKHRTWR